MGRPDLKTTQDLAEEYIIAKAMREQIAKEPMEMKTWPHNITCCANIAVKRPIEAGAGTTAMPPLTTDGATSHPIASPRIKAQVAVLLESEFGRRRFAKIQNKMAGISQMPTQKMMIKGLTQCSPEETLFGSNSRLGEPEGFKKDSNWKKWSPTVIISKFIRA